MSSQILSSFSTILDAQTTVSISLPNITQFVDSFSVDTLSQFVEKIQPITTPFSFQNEDQEINFRSLIHYLNIGSHFEPMAHLAGQQSLSEVVLFGIIGSHITKQSLDARFMKSMTSVEVSQLFSIPRLQKQQSEHSWMSVEVPGPMIAYADILSSALVQDGGVLLSAAGYEGISNWLRDVLASECDVESMCRNMPRNLAGLDDR